MKVLYNTYPMAFHTPGGGEIQLLQYKKYLESKIDIQLLDIWNPEFLEHDLVHFFSCMSGSVHFLSYIKKLDLPLFISPNLWVTEETKEQYPFEEIRNDFILADFIISNSNAECDLLSGVFKIPREKFLTVYNGIEESFFHSVEKSLFLKHFNITSKFVLNVANIEPRKNQLALVKAIKHFPELTLIIIGHVRSNEYLQACIDEGGSQVKYIGSLPHESDLLKSAYAACEFFALPSTVETPGLAALEAAAAGAKILITSEGCTKEYFNDYAVYVDHTSVHDIERGIHEVIKKQKSNELSEHVKQNFLWQEVVKKLSVTYSKVDILNTLKITSKGFKVIEGDGQGNFFIWTESEIEFTQCNGIIKFLLRSIEDTTIDIIVNNQVVETQLRILKEWAPYTLCLQNPDDEKNTIVIRINNVSEEKHGIAIRDFQVENIDYNDKLSTLNKFKSRSNDFGNIENDGIGNYFMWSNEDPEIYLEVGTYTFLWRTINGNIVDIYQNGLLIEEQKEIFEEWNQYALRITNENNPVQIKLKNKNDLGLGIAIRDIEFIKGV